MLPRLYADFNNTDPQRRVRLITEGTIEDLRHLKLTLQDGLHVILTDKEIEIEAIVEHSKEEKTWVGRLVAGTMRDL